MPVGIVGSLAVCTILYILVSLVLTGIVKYTTLDVPDPIAVAVDAIHLPWLAFIVKIGAICGLSSVMLVLMYGQTRIFYTMARDGLLPTAFSRIHPKYADTVDQHHIGRHYFCAYRGHDADRGPGRPGQPRDAGGVYHHLLYGYVPAHQGAEPYRVRFNVLLPKVTPVLACCHAPC